MQAIELAGKLENIFGYNIHNHTEILAQLDEFLALSDDEEPEEIFAAFVEENIHWEAERQSDASPLIDAEQPPHILARHLAGLFTFRFGYSFGNTGTSAERAAWMVDLNPREDGLILPVYYQSHDRMRRWYIFESPGQLTACEELFYDVRQVYEEQPRKLKELSQQLVNGYPRACHLFAEWFKRHGVAVAKMQHNFPDLGAVRLFGAYEALLSIAQVLVTRTQGKRQAKLSAVDAQQCMAGAQAAPDYPPNLLVAMLGLALSGDILRAKEVAARIRQHNLGVALTSTWAQKVINDEPPFGC